MPTEYDYIDVIGTTHETSKDSTEKKMNAYYHRQEVHTVKELLEKMKLSDYREIVDLGSSVGTWYHDYKRLDFKKVIGIDISKERAIEAKKRGYDEVHICNASDLPFENESKNCIVSNDVFIHVLQDDDKLKIFKEIKRVLQNDGIFIFNFGNASGSGFKNDTTIKYCRWNTIKTISSLVNHAELHVEYVAPSYYAIPRVGAYHHIVSISTKLVFPLLDYVLKNTNNLNFAKVIYLGVRKIKSD